MSVIWTGEDETGERTVAQPTSERERYQEWARQWIERRGTESQRERLEAGMLPPRAEIAGAIESEIERLIWQPLAAAGLTPFEPADPNRLKHQNIPLHYGRHEIQFRSYFASTIAEDEWARLKEIEALARRVWDAARLGECDEDSVAWNMEGLRVALRRHRLTCINRHCAAWMKTPGIDVRLAVGPIQFSKEYAL